jgi:hypothetical protein
VRKVLWAALVAGLGLVSRAGAQTPASPLNQPRKLSFKPVATKNLAAPAAAQQSSGFGIGKFIPKLSMPSFLSSPKVGSPPLPQTGLVPSGQAKGPLQPMRPFMSKN